MGRKSYARREMRNKISLSSRNQPSTAEDSGEEKDPSTRNVGNSTHFPLAALCLSLCTAGRQQCPFQAGLSCPAPLCSQLSRAAKSTALGKTRGENTENSHKNPASATVGFAWLSELVCQALSFPKGR